MSRPRSAAPAARRAVPAILAVVALVGLLPPPGFARGAGAPGADLTPGATAPQAPVGATHDAQPETDAPPDGAGDEPPQLPSIAYDEAMAHANDGIDFTPGGRVTRGFTPRASDGWPVDGASPTALPGGRATGREMAASREGSTWASTGRGHPGDTPRSSGTPSTPVDAAADAPAIAASGVSFAASPAPAASPVEPAAAGGLRRQVFGFLPYWELSGASTKLNYGVLSTIAYFSVGADRLGNLRKRDPDGSRTTGWGGWTSSSMTSVISAAHRHGTRVVLTVSVFAWTSSQAAIQRAILGSASARLRLARQVAAAVRDRGADGVNLDFEPLASGYADEFVALLRTMRTQLNHVRRGYQLTYDTTGSIGNYPLEASVGSGAADAIFVMGYDYRISSSSTAGSIDPLSGGTYDLADTVRSYTARVSPSRVILGLPWYGRAWSTDGSGARANNISGARYGYSTAVNYENVVALARQHGRRWDTVEQSPYVVYRRRNCTSRYGCVTAWRQVYYDDATSLKRRLALVNDYRLRGAGLWALGYDGGHAELYRAVSESFLVDAAAPQSGIRLLATDQGDEGFVVSWAARDQSSVVGYDVQVSLDGGAWRTWLTNTRATSDVWLGVDGHGYAFRVRAVDSKGHRGAWNVGSTYDATPSLRAGGFGRVTAGGLSYRAGPHTSSAKLGALRAGTIVALTRGPIANDGYTWFEATEPIREWSPVSFVERGVWIAVRSSGGTFVAPYRAPNSTVVDAGIRRLDFDTGSAVGTAAGAVAKRAFSPDGDGSRDSIRLHWTNTVVMDSLTLRVYRSGGAYLGSRSVPDTGAGSQSWDWNGEVGGVRVRDGKVMLQLVGTRGSRTYRAPSVRPITARQVAAYAITIDTVSPRIASASASTALLSPNGDGYRDSVRLALSGSGATKWAVRIASSAGTVRTASGHGDRFVMTWRGERNGGGRAPDGRYVATLQLSDNAGNVAHRSYAITVDTTAPSVARTATPVAFSPGGDGAAETTRLAWSANESISGAARIYRGSSAVRSWAIHGRSGAMTWDGRDGAGRRVAEGRYSFRVDVKDAAGNRRVASTPVVVDRTASYLRWSRGFYPQDADTLAQSSLLTWRLARDATTTLKVYDAGGHLVTTAWAGRRQAAGHRQWTWYGKRSDGSYVPQGTYQARLTVTSALGTVTIARSVSAAAFSISPSATRLRAGQTLRLAIRSNEPLGSTPVVSFKQAGLAAVSVRATRLADGSYRASFRVRAGGTGAASVRVSATDDRGRTNGSAIAVRIVR